MEGNVSLRTSHGDVDLARIDGERLEIRSSQGDVKGELLAGRQVDVQTSHADIEFDVVDSGQFSARTSHADVEIGSLRGETRIRTSHGNISVDMSGGAGADLRTSHGNVIVYMDGKSGMDVDLRGKRVNVARGFQLDADISEDDISGRINGGGPLLRARTSHGRIDIR